MEKEKIVAILYGYRETRARANCLREEITLLEKRSTARTAGWCW